jgi:hypothetical protein
MTLPLPDDGSPATADLVVEYRAKRIVSDGAGIAPSGAPRPQYLRTNGEVVRDGAGIAPSGSWVSSLSEESGSFVPPDGRSSNLKRRRSSTPAVDLGIQTMRVDVEQ